jgi:hypothetical protein
MLRSYIESGEDITSSTISTNMNRIFIICFAFAIYIILYTIVFTLCDMYDMIHTYIKQFIKVVNKTRSDDGEIVLLYKDMYLKKIKTDTYSNKPSPSNTYNSEQTKLQNSPTYTKIYSTNQNSNIKKRYTIHDSDFIVPLLNMSQQPTYKSYTSNTSNTPNAASRANSVHEYDTSSEGSRVSPLPRTSKTPIFHKDHFNV